MSESPHRPATPILVVVGPSGSGKSTAVRALADRGLLRIHPTWTTRPRRPDEREGSAEHRFVGAASFDRLRDRGFFLDTVELFGLPHRYGLPPVHRCTDGRVDTVMLRAPLVERFRVAVRVKPVVVQIETGADQLAQRLRARSTTDADVAARLVDNEREANLGRAVADVVVNNDGTVDDLIERLALVVAHLAATPGSEVAA